VPIPRGEIIEFVTAPDPDFLVVTETGWDPPTRRASHLRWVSVVIDLLSPSSYSSGQDLSTGEPKWRVVLQDVNGQRWAESAWRRDWSEAERLQAEWQARAAGNSAAAVRSMAWQWNGE
jgi:hypothetical protein